MITVKVGNFPIRIKQEWSEVTYQEALDLYNTENNELHKRLSILSDIPSPEHLNLYPDSVLALYEIVSFVEEIPEVVKAKERIKDSIAFISEWTFAEFETARQLLLKHPEQPALCMAKLAEIKGKGANYLEIGCHALDGIFGFMNHYAAFGIFDEVEPQDEEIEAGIERLQLFGVYPIAKTLGKAFGKLPREIEQEPVGWVIKEWVHTLEEAKYQNNLNQINKDHD